MYNYVYINSVIHHACMNGKPFQIDIPACVRVTATDPNRLHNYFAPFVLSWLKRVFQCV